MYGFMSIINVEEKVFVIEINDVGVSNVKSLAFSPNGKYLAAGSSDKSLILIDVKKMTVVK